MKYWGPVLAIHAPDSPPTAEELLWMRDSSGNDNIAAINAACDLTKFTKAGTLDTLLALVFTYYDLDLGVSKYYVEYTSKAGATDSIFPGGAGSFYQAYKYIFDLIPESYLTQENSLFMPLCLYSVKLGDTIASTYGDGGNGLDGGAIGEYLSRNYNTLFNPGPYTPSPANPAYPNVARNIQMYFNYTELSVNEQKIVQSMFLVGPQGTGQVSRTGGPSVDLDNIVRPFFDEMGSDDTNAYDYAVVPALQYVVPGDKIPFAIVVKGKNEGLAPGDPPNYSYSDWPFNPGVDRLLTKLHIKYSFDRVDAVHDQAILTNFV